MKSFTKVGLQTSLRRAFFRHCPSSLLQKVIRRMISFDYNHDPDLVVKLAETKEELEGAFQVLYRSYLEMGYCAQNESEMRLTIHHALPTTSVIIAKYKNKVVGTLTLVRDNNLKLPCEKEWSIDFLRTGDRRVAEITSLAVDKEFRRVEKGNILFPLLKFMYEFAADYFGTRVLSIIVHPKEVDFYEGLFFFQRIDDKVLQDYYGAPAVALYLDLKVAKTHYLKFYGRKSHDKNLYHYFTQAKCQSFIWPEKLHFSVDYPVLNKSLFRYFFFQVSNIGESLDPETLAKILKHYPGKDSDRVANRFSVDVDARIVDSETAEAHAVTITNISSSGLRLVSESTPAQVEFKPQRTYEIHFDPRTGLDSTVLVCRWQRDGNCAGFSIMTNQLKWFQFVKNVHRHYTPGEDVRLALNSQRLEKSS